MIRFCFDGRIAVRLYLVAQFSEQQSCGGDRLYLAICPGGITMNYAVRLAVLLIGFAGLAQAQDRDLTAGATFMFDGVSTTITPASAQATRHAATFAALPSGCDPQCIAPARLALGVTTLAEPGVLAFLVNDVGANAGFLVDARTPQDRSAGFIPGSVNLPHAALAPDNSLRNDILRALGVRIFEDVFNFADAQPLVVYDGGPTQHDAGALVAHLLQVGYPPGKISYYRGGMQVWSVLGLTVQELPQ